MTGSTVLSSCEERVTLAEDEFDAVLLRARPSLKRVLGYFRIPPEDAEDLLQQACLHTFRRWQDIHSYEGFLAGVLAQLCRAYWRRARKARLSQVDLTALERLALPIPPAQRGVEASLDLRRLLFSLRPRDRTVLWLRFVEELSANEMAGLLGVEEANTRKLVQRARGRLLEAHRKSDRVV